jgi:hypothetical protein
VSRTFSRTRRCPRRRAAARPHCERLEPRCLLTGPSILTPDALFHETLNNALDFGPLGLSARVGYQGNIGAGSQGAADVNWYQFQLSQTTAVHLTALPTTAGTFSATLGLYDDAPFDPFAPADPYTPDGHRLLAQDDATAHAGPATINRLLGPGTYWVAVSGGGNDYFYPFLAGSGLNGRTGPYQLLITTGDPGPGYGDPSVPVVLGSDPAPGAVLRSSPFVLHFDLNAAIDPSTIVAGNQPTDTAQLWYNTTSDFSATSTATQVDLTWATVSLEQNQNGGDNELEIVLPGPLGAGYYQVVLQGYGPGGGNYVADFQITGLIGNTDPGQQPGDSVYTAYNIPNVNDGRLHQVSGAIGVDPTDLYPGFDPAGVQFYQFTITGQPQQLYAFDAEVFANRIGSPLDSALTLYRLDGPNTLTFIASNGNTGNEAVATNRANPLYTDSALLLSLKPGQYFLAVSSGLDYPDPLDPTRAGVFNPLVPQQSWAGNSTGPYVLNLLVQPAGPAPHVVAVAPDTGPGGNGPLTGVSVRFDQPVNLLSLGFAAFQQSMAQGGQPNGALASVTLTDAFGQQQPLRLESYDPTTNTATFILLSPVPAGTYTLHLSGAGPQAITNIGGTPLAGNIPGSSDFVTTFAVTGTASSTSSVPTLPGFTSTQHAQDLGALFPISLSNGVAITRDATAGATGTEADYTFRVLQSRDYSLVISGSNLPPGIRFNLLDASGQVVAVYLYNLNQNPGPIRLDAGTYTLQMLWDSGVGNYTVTISVPGSPENPVSLTVGSGPALRARLLTNGPDNSSSPSPLIVGGPFAPPATPAATGSPLPLGAGFNLPSNAMTVVAFSPLNGVATPGGIGSDGGARLLVRAPAVPGLESVLLGVLIGTQPVLDDGSGQPVVPTPDGPSTSSTGQAVADIDTRTSDLFFESLGWFGIPLLPATPAAATPVPASQLPADDAGAGDGGLGSTQSDSSGEISAIPAVLALAAGAFLPQFRSPMVQVRQKPVRAREVTPPKPR